MLKVAPEALKMQTFGVRSQSSVGEVPDANYAKARANSADFLRNARGTDMMTRSRLLKLIIQKDFPGTPHEEAVRPALSLTAVCGFCAEDTNYVEVYDDLGAARLALPVVSGWQVTAFTNEGRLRRGETPVKQMSFRVPNSVVSINNPLVNTADCDIVQEMHELTQLPPEHIVTVAGRDTEMVLQCLEHYRGREILCGELSRLAVIGFRRAEENLLASTRIS